jgi:hypothetical protein
MIEFFVKAKITTSLEIFQGIIEYNENMFVYTSWVYAKNISI